MSNVKEDLIKFSNSIRFEQLYDMDFNLNLSDIVSNNIKNIKEDQEKVCNSLYKKIV